jgi:hypothetical protein
MERAGECSFKKGFAECPESDFFHVKKDFVFYRGNGLFIRKTGSLPELAEE